MKLFFWDKYNKDEINEKIKYWVDIWEDLIDNYKINSYGLNLFNIHTIINDIIDEAKYNKMKSKENRKYFLQKIDYFIENDEVIKENYIFEFKIIREYLNSNNIKYLLATCKKVYSIFNDNSYLNKTYDKLNNILLNTKTEDIEFKKIKSNSQNIIVELLMKGYTLKKIKEMPCNIFNKYELYSSDLVITSYPHNINYKDFNDNKKYVKAISEKIDNLSIENRLDAFYIYLNKKSEDYLVILEVEGIKGQTGMTIGDVEFYYPRLKKYVNSSNGMQDIEFFHESNNKNIINAIVKTNSVDYEKAVQLAINKIERAFDVIQCFYKSELNLRIIKNIYIVTDKSGNLVSSGGYSSEINELLKNQYSRNLDIINKNVNANLILSKSSKYLYKDIDNQSFTEQKIVYSLHWLRKADEANKPEDKLLNYWIAIENLIDFKEETSIDNNIFLNKEKETEFKLAYEVIPCMELIFYKNNVCKDLYDYIEKLEGMRSNNTSYGIKYAIELPEEIRKKCNLYCEDLKEGEEFSLVPFIENLNELLKYTNRKIIRDKINFTNKFYSDLNFAKGVVDKRIKEVKDDVLCIYRYRNKIVHNAQYDNTMLPFYVAKAQKYANRLLSQIMFELSTDNKSTLESIFLKWHLNKKIFINKLENKSLSKLIDYSFN